MIKNRLSSIAINNHIDICRGMLLKVNAISPPPPSKLAQLSDPVDQGIRLWTNSALLMPQRRSGIPLFRIAHSGRREKPTTPWQDLDSCIIGPGSNFPILNPPPCRPAWRAGTPSPEPSNATSRRAMARIARIMAVTADIELYDACSSAERRGESACPTAN